MLSCMVSYRRVSMTANTSSYRHLDIAGGEVSLCRRVSLPEKAKKGREFERDANAACSGYEECSRWTSVDAEF